jgi:hypothetical protein
MAIPVKASVAIDLVHVVAIRRRIQQVIATPSIMVAAIELQRLHDDISFMIQSPIDFATVEWELAGEEYRGEK